jgi:cation/acetate symporter
MFLIFIAITLGITYWASKRSAGASAYFAASRRVTGWQNGIAVAGDYMSAASFLGIAGIIAFQGYDGFMFSVGWLVAYLTVLLVVAEPLRNAGRTPWPTSSPTGSSLAPCERWPPSAR